MGEKEGDFNVKSVFYIKNMVGNSCVRLINLSFANVDGLILHDVRLGEINVEYAPNKIQPKQIEQRLNQIGFHIILDEDERLIENIKIAAIELIHYANNTSSLINNSNYIEEKLSLPYSKLSRVFSDKTSTTLEKYIISLKIEKVKDLILNKELTLSEIAYKMGYSSVHYLSNQFKKKTGISVSKFKKNPAEGRVALEELV